MTDTPSTAVDVSDLANRLVALEKRSKKTI
jgi:hypothetical protein